jgi:hypothetical protein
MLSKIIQHFNSKFAIIYFSIHSTAVYTSLHFSTNFCFLRTVNMFLGVTYKGAQVINRHKQLTCEQSTTSGRLQNSLDFSNSPIAVLNRLALPTDHI